MHSFGKRKLWIWRNNRSRVCGEIGLLLGFLSSQCSLVLPWKVSSLHLRFRGCLEFYLTTSNFVNIPIVKSNSYLSTTEACWYKTKELYNYPLIRLKMISFVLFTLSLHRNSCEVINLFRTVVHEWMKSIKLKVCNLSLCVSFL